MSSLLLSCGADLAGHDIVVSEALLSAGNEIAGAAELEVNRTGVSGRGSRRDEKPVGYGEVGVGADSGAEIALAKAIDALVVEVDAGEVAVATRGDAEAEGLGADKVVGSAVDAREKLSVIGIGGEETSSTVAVLAAAFMYQVFSL